MKPNILLITGPQGSGNHVFSKCFAMHEYVRGWDDLLDQYWIRHEFEPFSDVWRRPDKIPDMDWSHSNYVLSVSCPYVDTGETIIPDYERVLPQLQKVGNLCVGLIGREEYILKQQEMRLRGTHSYHQFLAVLDYLGQYNPVYLSQELLYLYRNHYLKSLVPLVNVPIDHNNPKLNDILRENPNAKYVHYVQDHWLDSNRHYFEREGYVKQLG